MQRRVEGVKQRVRKLKGLVEWPKRRQSRVENAKEVMWDVEEVERGVGEVDIDVEEVMRNLQG